MKLSEEVEEEIRHWASYADKYFQDKWNLEENVSRIVARIEKLEKVYEAAGELDRNMLEPDGYYPKVISYLVEFANQLHDAVKKILLVGIAAFILWIGSAVTLEIDGQYWGAVLISIGPVVAAVVVMVYWGIYQCLST